MKKLADISAFERLGQIQYSPLTIFNDRALAIEYVSQINTNSFIDVLEDVYKKEISGDDSGYDEAVTNIATMLSDMMYRDRNDDPFTAEEFRDAIYAHLGKKVPKDWIESVASDALYDAQKYYREDRLEAKRRGEW